MKNIKELFNTRIQTLSQEETAIIKGGFGLGIEDYKISTHLPKR